MAEVTIAQKEIDDLAKKIDQFGSSLNERERAVLLGVFSQASSARYKAIADARGAGLSVPTTPPPIVATIPRQLPSLSDRFKDSFWPGRAGRYEFAKSEAESDVESLSVGATTVTWGR